MKKQNLTPDELGKLFLILALGIGGWFRIFPPLDAGFPINDGGLFYVMIKAIQANGYRLPEYVHYNGLSIPFVYPPLAFYISGLVTDLLHIDLIETMRWLPATVLILTIPVVYYFAFLLLGSKFKAGLAAFIYSVLPRALNWLIMGGGVTRSIGQLFMLLAAINLYQLYTNNKKKNLVLSLLFSALVCITHPEATIHTIGIAFVLWLFYGRNKLGITNSIIIGIGTLLLTSFWWATMLTKFGLEPFQSASQTGFHDLQFIIAPFIPFSEESFLPVIAVLAIIGIGTSLAQKKYILPVLFYFPFIIEPRNAPNVSIIPMAFLTSLALSDVIFPMFSQQEGKARNTEFSSPLQSRSEIFFIAFCMIALLLGVQLSGDKYSSNHVSSDTRTAFNWVVQNTSPNDTFIILTGAKSGLGDYTNEWFPALTDRESVTTIQGKEWLGKNSFYVAHTAVSAIQECIYNINTLDCVDNLANTLKFEYDYVIFKVQPAYLKTDSSESPDKIGNYEIVYQSNDVIILKK